MRTKTLPEEERQRVIEEWERRDQQLDALLSPRQSTLVDLAAAACHFFEDCAAGRTYSRRPSLGFRLHADGSPFAWVSLYPAWDSRLRTLKPTTVHIDFLVQRSPQCSPCDELCMTVEGERIQRSKCSVLYAEESLLRLLDTAHAFLVDPAAVFARSADHCCVCRKALTDGQSRARGIGPECLDRARIILRWLEKKVIAS